MHGLQIAGWRTHLVDLLGLALARASSAIPFSDLALSRHLERAEGYTSTQFAEAWRCLFPASAAEWMECAGAYADVPVGGVGEG